MKSYKFLIPSFITLALLIVLPLQTGAHLDVGIDYSVDTSVKTTGSSTTNSSIDSGTNVNINLGSTDAHDADLNLKIEAVAKDIKSKNSNVAEVRADGDESLEVEYRHKGKLFGFWDVAVKSKTKVELDAEGKTKVKTSMPWWNIFVVGTNDVSSSVDTSLSSSSSINAGVQADSSLSSKTQLIQTIVAAHAAAEAKAAASTETE